MPRRQEGTTPLRRLYATRRNSSDFRGHAQNGAAGTTFTHYSRYASTADAAEECQSRYIPPCDRLPCVQLPQERPKAAGLPILPQSRSRSKRNRLFCSTLHRRSLGLRFRSLVESPREELEVIVASARRHNRLTVSSLPIDAINGLYSIHRPWPGGLVSGL